MKSVTLINEGAFKSIDVLSQVASQGQGQSIPIDQMRLRVKILEKIEALGDAKELLLEDAEHSCLVAAVKSFPWAVASKNVLSIIDSVLDAVDVAFPRSVN